MRPLGIMDELFILYFFRVIASGGVVVFDVKE
jgi:hypothetical protein